MKKNVLFIDATTVREGGCFTLLQYLAQYLNDNNHKFVVFGNTELKENLKNQNVEVKVANIFDVLRLYVLGKNKTLYFCNRGPLLACRDSAIYLQTEYATLKLIDVYKLNIKSTRKVAHTINYIMNKLSSLIGNNRYFVQTPHMQSQLKDNLGIDSAILPFFPNLKVTASEFKKYDFCYISYPWPHKQHNLLLDFLLTSSNDIPGISCALTIPDDGRFASLINKINEINSEGIHRIKNLGSVPKEDILSVYAQSKALLMLSLKESFGLPLIEACQAGVPIIAPNLEYVSSILDNYHPINVFDSKIFAEDMRKYLRLLKANSLGCSNLVISDGVSDLVLALEGKR